MKHVYNILGYLLWCLPGEEGEEFVVDQEQGVDRVLESCSPGGDEGRLKEPHTRCLQFLTHLQPLYGLRTEHTCGVTPVARTKPHRTNPNGQTPVDKPQRTNPSGQIPVDKPQRTNTNWTNPTGQTPTDKPQRTNPDGQTPSDKPHRTNPNGQTPTDKPQWTNPDGQTPMDKHQWTNTDGQTPTDKHQWTNTN